MRGQNGQAVKPAVEVFAWRSPGWGGSGDDQWGRKGDEFKRARNGAVKRLSTSHTDCTIRNLWKRCVSLPIRNFSLDLIPTLRST